MTLSTERPATLARELSERAHAIEHAVGESIEHGLHAVEDTVARRYGARAVRALRAMLRALGWLAAASFFAFGLTLLVLRYWLLPGIDGMRPRIEAIASSLLKSPVTIGRIDASWQGVNPVLALQDVRLGKPGGGAALALPRIEGTLSWTSLTAMQPRFWRLRIYSPELEVVLLPDGMLSIAGFVSDTDATGSESPILDWLLAQRQVVIRDASVVLRDERSATAREIAFSNADLLLQSGFGGYRIGLQLAPPAEMAAPIDLRGRFQPPTFGRRSDFAHWSGELFAQVDYVDLGLLNQWLRAPVDVQRAAGAVRAWLRVDNAEVVGATLDLALKDVDARLAADLQPLRLSSFQGRVTQKRWGDEGRGGQELGLIGTTFQMANGARFPPLDLTYRWTRASVSRPPNVELAGSRIDLPSLANIATHLPLGRSVREAIERHAPRGRLSDFALSWDGDEPEWRSITGKARFEELSIAAQAAAGEAGTIGSPGFERLSGSVQLERGSGSLKLATRDAALSFPGVFRDSRILITELNADLEWKQGPQTELRIGSLQLANADLEITASGLWRAARAGGGPGEAELSGRIVRLEARSAYRYVPLNAGLATLGWLQYALLDGRLSDGSFRLRGDLSKFPFATAADGEFRAGGRLRGGVLDVAPAADANGQRTPGSPWPLLRDLDAEVAFERQGMNVRAQRGTIGGSNIVEATARIPDLGRDTTLEVRGVVAGELAQMLDYVNASPLVRTLGPVSRGALARGPARLDLKLDIPLTHASDLRLAGGLVLLNNDLTIVDVPPFTRIGGTVNFTERGVRFDNVAAGFLGGQARFDATTRADGAIVVNAAGAATVPGMRRAFAIGIVQRLLDRMQGTARYTAALTIHGGTLALQADSDLVGVAIDAVAPLRKAAGEPLALRLEKTSQPDADDLRVTAGKLIGVRLERRRDHDVLKLARGVVAINEPANPPESGMLVLASMPRTDAGAWASWLGIDIGTSTAGTAAPSDSDDLQIDLVALKTAELVIGNRSFRDVTLGASRVDGGGFDVNIVADAAVGYIGWRPGAIGSVGAPRLGQISARLSKLVIPAAKTGEVVDVLRAPARQYPAIEVVVENFELGETKLGRLDLVAANSGPGAGAAWKLAKLEVTNPDMKLTAHGDWTPTVGGARKMQVKFAFDASDAGATLARFGMVGAMARGHGGLEGSLEWVGSPLEIDYPSLSGTLAVHVDDGRFLKVETRDAGRLLTVLSLQGLSRTLVTDTRESFGDGFAFSSIRADATVSRGVLSTQNFRMTGSSAAALMSGTVDLRKETQQLHLVVLPEIDASTAALALGVANPVIGLGALLANLVLKAPLSKAFALEYDITGSWNDPVVTRTGRIASATPENPR